MRPTDRAVTIDYKSDFSASDDLFRSAFLAAMARPAQRLRYRLVGTTRYGFIAFFAKNSHGEQYFPVVDVDSYLQDLYTIETCINRWPAAQTKNWQAV